jgi:hypothetical protein
MRGIEAGDMLTKLTNEARKAHSEWREGRQLV